MTEEEIQEARYLCSTWGKITDLTRRREHEAALKLLTKALDEIDKLKENQTRCWDCGEKECSGGCVY